MLLQSTDPDEEQYLRTLMILLSAMKYRLIESQSNVPIRLGLRKSRHKINLFLFSFFLFKKKTILVKGCTFSVILFQFRKNRFYFKIKKKATSSPLKRNLKRIWHADGKKSFSTPSRLISPLVGCFSTSWFKINQGYARTLTILRAVLPGP